MLRGLWQEPEAYQVVVSPARATQDLPNCFRPKGVTEIMIHDQDPATIEMLVYVVGALGFSPPEPIAFNSPNPLSGSRIF